MMKPMTHGELVATVSEMRSLIGGQLQEISAAAHELGLGIYSRGQLHWIWFDLNPVRPSCILPGLEAPVKKARVTPVLLFLRAHARSRILTEIEVAPGERILNMKFGRGESACLLEARLFPHGQNVIVTSESAQISYAKIQPLQPHSVPFSEAAARTPRQIYEDWLKLKKAPLGKVDESPNLERQMQKKEKALGEMTKNLARLQSVPWSVIGEHLKTWGFAELQPAWNDLVDQKKSVAWNIQNCFKRAKETEQKVAGQQERIELIRNEIAKLNLRIAHPEITAQEKQPAPLVKKGAARFRSHEHAGFVMHIGKSARDNLALLRAARGWDFWLHLRDYPGAHGIVRREKDQLIPRESLIELSRFLIGQSLSNKILVQAGGTFDVILTECRFVRPIKGDRLGRVHYSHEQTLTVRM